MPSDLMAEVIYKEGRGRKTLADWRYEGKGSFAEKPGSRCDNDNERRPVQPLAFKKKENPWEEILTETLFLLPYFSDKVFFPLP